MFASRRASGSLDADNPLGRAAGLADLALDIPLRRAGLEEKPLSLRLTRSLLLLERVVEWARPVLNPVRPPGGSFCWAKRSDAERFRVKFEPRPFVDLDLAADRDRTV
jgi:hypothetical protein